ncbi:MAG: putative regulatory protein [Bacteroidetes bacterium]|jgi:RNA polymerase-binding transcription factor DksA|nr:putative regulatory protein [Bacteroidota bacterium]MDF2450955.1 putative regulatory protein [Bacteroidota bacterium]
MAKKIVKPAKKASKPAPKKAVAKPAKKAASKPAIKKASKPAPKKPVAKKAIVKPAAKKVVAKKPVPKPAAKKVVVKKQAPKKVTKVPVKKAVKAAKPAPKKVEKKIAKPAPKAAAKPAKKVEAKPVKAVKEIAKPKVVGKPIDAVAKKGSKKAGKPAKSSKKGKKGDDEEDDIEPEEEDDSDVDVKDDYEKPEEDDDAVVDLDEAPVLDLEGGGIPLDDDDDDEIPEKRGRGRRKKNEGRSSGSESYIRNRPLHIDITKPLIKKPQAAQPKPFLNTKDDRSRYSDKELTEFKELIIDKLKEAQTDYDLLKQTLSNADNHGTDDTSPSFKLLEDGSDVLSKEETAQLAVRQEKYIVNLKNALMRIENKTYGICRVTGKLIPKERLRSVPHATLGIDAKLNQSS